MIKSIKKELKSKNDKFIFAYSNEPDHTEHIEGVYNSKVEKIIKSFNKLMEKNFNNIKDDTLIIISADHGLIDIKETIYLEDHPKLLDTLYMLPTIEPRAASFVIKKDKKLEYESSFNELFQGKYVLFTREEVLKHNMFGYHELHPKASDFIGDYYDTVTKCRRLGDNDTIKALVEADDKGRKEIVKEIADRVEE
jgi:predicted AlkP superfamily pyrophosphatase or phosphodiesterase